MNEMYEVPKETLEASAIYNTTMQSLSNMSPPIPIDYKSRLDKIKK